MSAAVAAGAGAAPIPESIDGDSIWQKALTALPIIGCLVQVIAEKSLGLEAQWAVGAMGMGFRLTPPDVPRFIRAVEIKNQYKIIGIIRDIFTIAALVTGLALAVLTPLSVITIAAITVNIGLHAYKHYQNSQMLEDVRANGFGGGTRPIH